MTGRTLGRKEVSYIDSTNSDFPDYDGVYIGIVKQIDTATRSGKLRVYIPRFGGPDEDNERYWQVVNYASPFMGTTTGDPRYQYNPAKSQLENTFTRSFQSYGFFMTPPDLGSQVLCCFMKGFPEGYWFACINPSITKHMIPAIGAVPLQNIDPASIAESGLGPYLKPGLSYPVAEGNDAWPGLAESGGGYLPNILKPIHVPQTINLIRQGLEADPIRGAISSSIQRDPISNVFGFSTPGRPYGAQDPANDPTLQEKLKSGNFDPDTFRVTTRVGGHSLVMDDGDIYNKTNMVRLKTSAGHQILMNDSEGIIYISNASGMNWIEMTAAGDILVYSANDIAVRTQGNLMFHSDQNINFNAKQDIQLNAGTSIKMQSQVIQGRAEAVLNLFGRQAQVAAQGGLGLLSGGPILMKASGAVAINGNKIALNGRGGGTQLTPPQPFQGYSLPDTAFNDFNWEIQTDKIISINYKVPTHEPYIRGDIQAVIAEQNQQNDVNGNPISPEFSSSVGAELAVTQTLSEPAPVSSFINQPTPSEGIGILGQDETRALYAQVGFNSSNGSYSYVGPNGEQGKYAFTSEELQSLGYLKAGTPNTVDAINNPNNWIAKDGITNAEDLQKNAAVQEKIMSEVTKNNYAELQRLGVITSTTSQEDVAGYLNAAKQSNPAEVAKWNSGQPNANQNLGQAFNRGRYSQTQVPVIQESNQSKGL